jgi:polar amino acid transport system substrate-binding protein/cystine transport system substrate-binding protein/membrane-bound lytic murein transglycosylase F
MEVELLQAIAGEIGVRFVANTITGIGQNFDPSVTPITHSQCAIIGGGMLDTAATRSFLDVSPPYGETGWVLLAKTAGTPIAGTAIVLANVPGGDRVALSQFLRGQGVTVQLARSTDAVAEALGNGTANFAVLDALYARRLAGELGLVTEALPPPLGTHQLVFGLWKGDLTLKRAIEGAFHRLDSDGQLAALTAKYLED